MGYLKDAVLNHRNDDPIAAELIELMFQGLRS